MRPRSGWRHYWLADRPTVSCNVPLTLAESLKVQKWRFYLNKPQYTPHHIARTFETHILRFAFHNFSVCIAYKYSTWCPKGFCPKSGEEACVNYLLCPKFPLSSHYNSSDSDRYSKKPATIISTRTVTPLGNVSTRLWVLNVCFFICETICTDTVT